MTYIAKKPEGPMGKVVGTGQCVEYVKSVAMAPQTIKWTKGAKVKKSKIAKGTAIATFDDNGKYGNHTDGRSHAAIYLKQDDHKIYVIDQWSGQPVHLREIRFKNGVGSKVNDGDQYYVIE